MKKFDFKKVLILVLAFILVFALVACNKKDDGKKPVEESATSKVKIETYLDKLWAATNNINPGTFAEGDTMGVEADISVKLEYEGNAMEVGINFALIIDTDADATESKSAAKIRMYDVGKGKDLLTLYYFLNDPYAIYISFNGQNIKFEFDTGWNDTWGAEVFKFLNTEDETTNASIMKVLKSIAETGGNEFNLDKIISKLIPMLGISEEKLDEILGKVMEMFQMGDSDTGFTGEFLPLIKIVGGMLFDKNFTEVTDNKNGTKTYSGRLSGDVFALLGVSAMTDNLITNKTLIDIVFTMNDTTNKLVADSGVKINILMPGAFNGKNVKMGLNINKLRFTNIDEKYESSATDDAKAVAFFGMPAKTNFSSDFYFDINLAINAGGVFMINDGADAYSIGGAYTLNLKGTVDLKNAEGNKTKLFAALKYDGKAVMELDYNAAKEYLALAVYNDVKLKDGETKIIPALMNAFGKDLVGLFEGNTETILMNAMFNEGVYNESFKGVILYDVDVYSLFRGLFEDREVAADSAAVTDGYTETSTAGKYTKDGQDAYPWAINLKYVVEKLVKGFKSTSDGVSISLDSLGSDVAYVFKAVDYLFQISKDGKSMEVAKSGTKVIGTLSAPVGYSEVLALICSKFPESLSPFITNGYLPEGATTATVTKEQANFMWNVMIGKVAYDRAQGDTTSVTWKSTLGEANTFADEAAYKAFVEGLWPSIMYKYLKGSDFAGVSVEKMIENLAKGSITLSLGHNATEGAYLGISLAAGGNTLSIKASFNLKSGTYSDYGTVTIPEIAEFTDGVVEGWAVIKL